MMSDEKVPLDGELDGQPSAPPDAAATNMKSILNNLGSMTPASATAWVSSRQKKIKPWSEFLSTARFSKPTVATLPKRVVKNIDYFMTNYMFVFIGLIIFCILTSPLLLIVIGLCGGALYHISHRDKTVPMRVFGRELTVTQQYAAVGVLSVPLLWISGAGGVVFWILGASLLLIGAHAAAYQPIEDGGVFDVDMEEVVIS